MLKTKISNSPIQSFPNFLGHEPLSANLFFSQPKQTQTRHSTLDQSQILWYGLLSKYICSTNFAILLWTPCAVITNPSLGNSGLIVSMLNFDLS